MFFCWIAEYIVAEVSQLPAGGGGCAAFERACSSQCACKFPRTVLDAADIDDGHAARTDN
jgi:hypothetical protein